MSAMEQDTSPQAAERYRELLRGMSTEQRAAAWASLCEGVREMALAGLRSRHPQASEEELRVRLAVRTYGREIAQRLFGSVPDDAV